MEFLPGSHADEAVIQPDTFDAPIEVKGLSAKVMAGLFNGAASARAYWKPALQLTAALAGHPESPGPETLEQDLDDGRAVLRSGCPGKVMVESGHRLSEDLLQPQSLYLLLAQQWARAGLMLVHGAAFEFEGHGVLALGDRGAGKSVLTMAALAAGAKVVSDDWVMVGTAADGTVRAERLREFLMLRHGLVHDRLLSLPGLKPVQLRNRPKSVVRMHDQPDSLQSCFARVCRVDRLWLLQRPRAGRTGSSKCSPAQPAGALSAIIRATMPILFSSRFALEAAALRKSTEVVLSGKRPFSICTGPDLLDNPSKVIASLL